MQQGYVKIAQWPIDLKKMLAKIYSLEVNTANSKARKSQLIPQWEITREPAWQPNYNPERRNVGKTCTHWHTETCNQHGPAVQHRGLCSVLRGSWMGGDFRGEWIHVYVRLSPFAVCLKLSQHYLLISYTPIQNKKLKNK